MVWTTASLRVSMTDTVSLLVLATKRALPAAYSAVGCSPTSIDLTAAGRGRGVDDADGAGRRGAEVGVRGHVAAVGVDRRLARLRLPASLVADVELAADERQVPRRDADVPGLLDRAGRGVEGHDGVLAVDRDVERRPVGRVDRLPGRAECPSTCGSGKRVAVPRVPSALTGNRVRASCCGQPEELAVGRVGRALLADAAVGQLLVDPGGLADAVDQLVGRQVEDLEDHASCRRCSLRGSGRRR